MPEELKQLLWKLADTLRGKMDADDLRDDPFNAYGPGDVGTVRVAIEAEIHDEADDGH